MAENKNHVTFKQVVKNVCAKHKIDFDTLDKQKKCSVAEEAFRHFLIHCYARQVRQQVSPIYERSDDIELLRMVAVSKHHWLYKDISKMRHNSLLIALANEISDLKLPQKMMGDVLMHECGLLIPDKWIRHHTSN